MGWPKNIKFGRISPSSPSKNQLAYRIFRLSTIGSRLTYPVIWAQSEWTEHDFLEIWDLGNVSGSHFSKSRKTKLSFENACPWCFKFPHKIGFWKVTDFQIFRSLPLAILMIVWHKWEDGSWQVSMTAIDFSPTPWNFCPVMSQAVRKPCFSTSIPLGGREY